MNKAIAIKTELNVLSSLYIINRCTVLIDALNKATIDPLINEDIKQLYKLQISSLSRIRANENTNLFIYQQIREHEQDFKNGKIQANAN